MGVMTLSWKIVIDCADPHAQAAFWSAALGYTVETTASSSSSCWPPARRPEHDHDGVRAGRVSRIAGRPASRRPGPGDHRHRAGPTASLPAVPEPKTVKNRLHLDLHAGPEHRHAEVARLCELGATVLQEVKEPGTEHVVMSDPEGNEFCVQ